ncbi:hypothetical protein JVT61DRAFT_9409 [Boletus reticuloceps]|uniref:Uncharacterized protein n=1 Tax=Boletus reticuloceps TaxID=495285 RepID=A0A8I3A543_9AGAM|nr:hypothetical protein JVT61DRAFT_9409 [Boletus reticuloceps]
MSMVTPSLVYVFTEGFMLLARSIDPSVPMLFRALLSPHAKSYKPPKASPGNTVMLPLSPASFLAWNDTIPVPPNPSGRLHPRFVLESSSQKRDRVTWHVKTIVRRWPPLSSSLNGSQDLFKPISDDIGIPDDPPLRDKVF